MRFRPLGQRPEWCDVDVLRRLKRRTLAKLRKEVAPVEAFVLGEFLPEWQGLDPARGTRGADGLRRLEETLVQLEGLPMPWSSLLDGILPRRVPEFRPEMLDMLSASGAFVWIGVSPLGPSDGRIALYRREQARLLVPCRPAYTPASELEEAVLDHLHNRGASFTAELSIQQPTATVRELEETLSNLVWNGQITNDTFAPLEALGRSSRKTTKRSSRPGVVRKVSGRWSLVSELTDASVHETERAHARVSMLLERYGLVSRAAAQFEEIPGGYKLLYPVLREMEERGRLRRGHFVEELAGSQFGLPGRGRAAPLGPKTPRTVERRAAVSRAAGGGSRKPLRRGPPLAQGAHGEEARGAQGCRRMGAPPPRTTRVVPRPERTERADVR